MSSVNNAEYNLIEINMWQQVQRQFKYKLNVHAKMFSVIIFYQLFVSLLNILPTVNQSNHFNDYGFDVHIEYFDTSANVIVFTFIWAFVMGVSLTTKKAKLSMLAFVTNKESNHFANGMFIILLSLVGGITAWLAEYFVQTIVISIHGVGSFQFFNVLSITDILMTGLVAIMYVLLFSLLGYLVGEFAQSNMALVIVLIVFMLFIGLNLSPFQLWIGKLVGFYIQESDLLVFTIKVLATCIILFVLSMIPSRRLEVR